VSAIGSEELSVRVYGEPVGILSALDGGRTRFMPSSRWLEAGQHPPLGLPFLTDPRPRMAPAAAPAWFENLLPERGSRLRAWLCRQQGVRETGSLALLAAVGRDLPGAVEVIGEAGDHGEAVVGDEPSGQLRFSLAGVQLKLSMLLSGERFVIPARGETGDWIVKIPGDRFPELPEAEAATMSWARAAGLETPDFHVLPIERLHGVTPELLGKPLKAFAIKRFDRRDDGRIHQEDFAQALDFRPEQKYGDLQPGMTYDGMARLVRDVCREESLTDLIARLAFVVASGNDDAHLKNWSFQWGHEHRPWLSPCYDMVATISWPEFGWTRTRAPRLALSLGKEKSFADLDRRCLQKFAERTDVGNAAEIFMDSIEHARTAWPSVVERAPRCMVDAVEAHWRRVPLLQQAGQLRSHP